jgi:hypothetical protein
MDHSNPTNSDTNFNEFTVIIISWHQLSRVFVTIDGGRIGV